MGDLVVRRIPAIDFCRIFAVVISLPLFCPSIAWAEDPGGGQSAGHVDLALPARVSGDVQGDSWARGVEPLASASVSGAFENVSELIARGRIFLIDDQRAVFLRFGAPVNAQSRLASLRQCYAGLPAVARQLVRLTAYEVAKWGAKGCAKTVKKRGLVFGGIGSFNYPDKDGQNDVRYDLLDYELRAKRGEQFTSTGVMSEAAPGSGEGMAFDRLTEGGFLKTFLRLYPHHNIADGVINQSIAYLGSSVVDYVFGTLLTHPEGLPLEIFANDQGEELPVYPDKPEMAELIYEQIQAYGMLADYDGGDLTDGLRGGEEVVPHPSRQARIRDFAVTHAVGFTASLASYFVEQFLSNGATAIKLTTMTQVKTQVKEEEKFLPKQGWGGWFGTFVSGGVVFGYQKVVSRQLIDLFTSSAMARYRQAFPEYRVTRPSQPPVGIRLERGFYRWVYSEATTDVEEKKPTEKTPAENASVENAEKTPEGLL